MAYAGFLAYPFGQAADVLRAYAQFSEQAPDRLALYAALDTAPSLPFIPEGPRGQRVAGWPAPRNSVARACHLMR